MPRIFDSPHSPTSSLGHHYNEVLRTTLASLWRRKLIILKTVAVALAIGIVVAFALPKRYTSEAFVHGDFTAPYDVTASRPSTGGPIVSFDASLLVETRSRLLQSHQLARRVVDRLGLERLGPGMKGGQISSWLHALFYGEDVKTPDYQKDLAAHRLLGGLSVKTEPRVYMIKLQYTAGNPELAALVTNAFLAEFLRITTLEGISQEHASAHVKLSEHLLAFGDKHPKVKLAKARVAAADTALEQKLAEVPKDVTFAQPVAIPSSPNPPLIVGMALLLGLAVGTGLAYWVERGNTESRLSLSPRLGERRKRSRKRQQTVANPKNQEEAAALGQTNGGAASEAAENPAQPLLDARCDREL